MIQGDNDYETMARERRRGRVPSAATTRAPRHANIGIDWLGTKANLAPPPTSVAAVGEFAAVAGR